MGSGAKKRALSVRQPWAELIMQGKKTREYRGYQTSVRGEVFIYACKTMWDGGPEVVYKAAGPQRGVVVGSVEIVDCVPYGDGYAWVLKNPRRVKQFQPSGRPQPAFFFID